MRWSIFGLSLFLIACGDETLRKVEYSPPVAVEAHLADETITAGEETSVECELKTADGSPVMDPQSYTTYVEEQEGLDVRGYTVGSTTAGEYDVRCGIIGLRGEIDQVPDRLTVEVAEARRMELYVVPDESFYSVDDSVDLLAVVYDEYDNADEDLAALIEWSIPSSGLTEVSSEPGERTISFDADGHYPVSASIGAPYDMSTPERVLVCDSAAPVIDLISPGRGESLDESAITVTGTVVDETSGVASLTVNGTEIDVASDHTFTAELEPTHGLNHIAVVAVDEAGHVAEAFTSVYHSFAWRPLEGDSFEEAMPEGLGVHLSQDVIDSGERECAKDGDGTYLCDAYEDMATVTEVLLNTMDLTEMAEGEIYEYGPIELMEEYLGSQYIDTPDVFGLDPYRIHGSFVLRGEYTISANVQSVEIGRAEMGDRDAGILGLEAVDGGLDFLAFVGSDDDLEVGLRIALEIRIDTDVRLYFTMDDSYHPDNGVTNLNTGEDVTDGACGDLGTLDLIDIGLNAFGYDSNLRGYLCQNEPLAHSHPHAFTGATVDFETVKLSARLLLDTTTEGDVDVTLLAHQDELLVDFMGESINVESDEEITIDLTSVEIIGGWASVDLGHYSIGNPTTLLDPILTTLLTELQLLVAIALEDLIICEGSISGCPLDVEGLIEDIFNSLAHRDETIEWPGVLPDGDDMLVNLSQYFSSLDFSRGGGRMAFDSVFKATRHLHESAPEPLGALLRGDCAGTGALDSVPNDRHMAAGFDLDLVNQALLAGWYNGGLSGTLEPSSPSGSIGSLTVTLNPLLPPVMTACTGDPDELEFQLGAAELELTMTISGVPVQATVYSDLALPVEPHHEDGRLDLLVSGEPSLNELELLSTDVRLGTHEQTIKDLLAGEIMPDLLARFGETVLGGMPVPTINVAAASLPGLGLEIELDFPVTEAAHQEAVIVIVSD